MYRSLVSNSKMPTIEFLGSDAEQPDESIGQRKPKRRRADDESIVSAEAPEKLTLETIRRRQQGVFAEMKCLVCEKMLGATVQIDDKRLSEWNDTYYTLCDYISPDEMYDYLAKQYNSTLATEGETLTALQVRNHFESNHNLDANWSLRATIRNMETMETQLSKHCFTEEGYDAKAIDSFLKVAAAKHTLYNTRNKRLAG